MRRKHQFIRLAGLAGIVATLMLAACDDDPTRGGTQLRNDQGELRTDRRQPPPRRQRRDNAPLALDGTPALTPTTNFAVAEPGEAFPGGAATSAGERQGQRALLQAAANLPANLGADFREGAALFRERFDPTPTFGDSEGAGLGPLFNADSCEACHRQGGRSRSVFADREGNILTLDALTGRRNRMRRVPRHSVLLRIAGADGIDDGVPVVGFQLQDTAVSGVNAEAELFFATETQLAGDGQTTLQKPIFSLRNLPSNSGFVTVSPRTAQAMGGLGLIEHIPDAAIKANADPDDADGDGISGRAHTVVQADGTARVGRFGWKAGKVTVRGQTTAALFFDMGISTPDRPEAHGDCTDAQTRCLATAVKHLEAADKTVDDPEMTEGALRALVVFSENVAPPPRTDIDSATVLRGKALFYQTGCTSCHTPKFETAALPGGGDTAQGGSDTAHLGGQVIWPYSDLLLHDMGEALADGFIEGEASGREWRTAPLWGIGTAEGTTRGVGYLHDGRATTIREAILWHGGEAEDVRRKVELFTEDEWDDLLAFLNAL